MKDADNTALKRHFQEKFSITGTLPTFCLQRRRRRVDKRTSNFTKATQRPQNQKGYAFHKILGRIRSTLLLLRTNFCVSVRKHLKSQISIFFKCEYLQYFVPGPRSLLPSFPPFPHLEVRDTNSGDD